MRIATSFLDWLLGATGSGLNAYGQGQQQQANIPFEQTPKGKAAQLLSRGYWLSQLRNMQTATGVLNADPLGADQRYAQRNALLSAILPNLTNMRTTPPDAGVSAAMHSRATNAPSSEVTPMNDTAMVQQRKQPTSPTPNGPVSDVRSMFGSSSGLAPRTGDGKRTAGITR